MISQSPSPTFKPWWRSVWISRFTVAPIGAFLLLLALACGASGSASDTATPEASARCGPEYVMAGDAGQHMGEEVTVCGYVQDYYYSDTGERPTLLLFDAVAGVALQRFFLGVQGHGVYPLIIMYPLPAARRARSPVIPKLSGVITFHRPRTCPNANKQNAAP